MTAPLHGGSKQHTTKYCYIASQERNLHQSLSSLLASVLNAAQLFLALLVYKGPLYTTNYTEVATMIKLYSHAQRIQQEP